MTKNARNIDSSSTEQPQQNCVRDLDRAIDSAVSAAMSLKGEDNEEPRRVVVQGLSDLADAERQIGVGRKPEKRFRYVAGLADTDEPGNVAASEVITALKP